MKTSDDLATMYINVNRFKGMLRQNIEHFLKKHVNGKLGFSEMN